MCFHRRSPKKLIRETFVKTAIAIFGCVSQTPLAYSDNPQPPVVMVNATIVPDGVRYDYQVINNSSVPITSLVVGLNYNADNSELKTPPSGWSLSGGIPTTSVTSPIGWLAKIVTTEDTNLLQLQWKISNQSNAIGAGQSVRGFSIIVPKADRSYMTSDWTTYTNSRTINYFTSKLKIVCDTPMLSLSLSPNVLWPPNQKLVTMQATVAAQDLNYPNPSFQLQSITANESLASGDVVAQFGTPATSFQVRSARQGNSMAGRTYTVTYSASNSCGNSATMTATILVPHDQR